MTESHLPARTPSTSEHRDLHRRRPDGRTSRTIAAAAVAVATAAGTLTAGAVGGLPAAQAATSASASGSAAVATERSGAYTGGLRADLMHSWEAWRGTPAGVVLDFEGGKTWTKGQNTLSGWTKWTNGGYNDRMVVSLPLLPKTRGASLDAGAQGSYDDHWRTVAARLVSLKMSNATIRIGWEMNGRWYAWSAVKDPQTWVDYYRRAVTIMRQTPGQNFTFTWNPTLGEGTRHFDPSSAYPGDDYVDTIGLDVYDTKWGQQMTPQERWSLITRESYGLNWWTAFAAAHGKQLCMPEWGLVSSSAQGGGGGGDDSDFIAAMDTFISTHDVAYDVYYEKNAGDGHHKLEGSEFPRAAAEYRARF